MWCLYNSTEGIWELNRVFLNYYCVFSDDNNNDVSHDDTQVSYIIMMRRDLNSINYIILNAIMIRNDIQTWYSHHNRIREAGNHNPICSDIIIIIVKEGFAASESRDNCHDWYHWMCFYELEGIRGEAIMMIINNLNL